mmetsp:Transcript_18343/g.41974  ORF Transcript_18343/g.41974 Transcript_18343/m.41974 type:complete len:252 (-) Transcript_18343:332-1087(-)
MLQKSRSSDGARYFKSLQKMSFQEKNGLSTHPPSADGLNEGFLDGTTDGLKDATGVGSAVGDVVGVLVGVLVGDIVGLQSCPQDSGQNCLIIMVVDPKVATSSQNLFLLLGLNSLNHAQLTVTPNTEAENLDLSAQLSSPTVGESLGNADGCSEGGKVLSRVGIIDGLLEGCCDAVIVGTLVSAQSKPQVALQNLKSSRLFPLNVTIRLHVSTMRLGLNFFTTAHVKLSSVKNAGSSTQLLSCRSRKTKSG